MSDLVLKLGSAKCQTCAKDAVAIISWGVKEFTTSIPVCSDHGREIWQQCQPLVNSGNLMWKNEDVKTS